MPQAMTETIAKPVHSTATDAAAERSTNYFEQSLYGIFRVSPAGEFLEVNPPLIRFLGCQSSEEVLQRSLPNDVFRYPEECFLLLRDCRAQGIVQSAQAEWRRKDGGNCIVRLHLRCLPKTGAGESIEGTVEDITELRELERQLREAQKFESIGQLAGGIAHDFNNVIGAILGWAELGYEQCRTQPQIAERFSRIREQGERAATLTRELLAFARRQAMSSRKVDVNTIVARLGSLLDKVLKSNVELSLSTGEVPLVKADPNLIEQVVMNLCLNACDAMPEGGRLTVETQTATLDESYCRFYPYISPGRYVVLAVADTGTGIDPEVREHIFEPLFTTKSRSEHTGMGLATSYGIVKQHGGFIHVYSEPGQGSLFRVYLPVLEREQSARAHAPVLGHGPESPRGTEVILYAEDHESIRDMVRQTLSNLGYRVLSAEDGEQALMLCQNEEPALAVLDIVMPRLGGRATAQRLQVRFRDLPILFTSGYAEGADPGGGGSSPFPYLQKPYSPTSLAQMVRTILDQRKDAMSRVE